MSLIDIVFQSGEFNTPDCSLLSDFGIAIIGAAIGSGTTLWVFNKQNQKEKVKEIEERKQFQSEKIAFLKNAVSDSKAQIETQINCYEEFLKNVKAEDYYIPTLLEPPLKDLDLLINKINREEFFHSYMNYFNCQAERTVLIEEFRKIFLCLYAFDDNFKKIQKLYLECNRNNVTSTQTFDDFKVLIKKSVTDAVRINLNTINAQLFYNAANNGFAKVLAASNNNEDYYKKINEYLSEITPFAFQLPEASNLYNVIEKAVVVFESKNNNVRRIWDYISKFEPTSSQLLTDLNTFSKRLLDS